MFSQRQRAASSGVNPPKPAPWTSGELHKMCLPLEISSRMKHYLHKATEALTADVIKDLHALQPWRYQSPPPYTSQRAENTQRLFHVTLSESMFTWWIQRGRLPFAKVHLLKWRHNIWWLACFQTHRVSYLLQTLEGSLKSWQVTWWNI